MKRNKFSLSHYKLTTMDMGRLVPIACFEVLPGDTLQMATSALIRCQPMVAPPMHPVHVKIHHWFVPNRIIWDDFEKFITGGEYSAGPQFYDHPYMDISGPTVTPGTLSDYLGIPTGVPTTMKCSALPFRAYTAIYNEFYRDNDISTYAPLHKANGVDTITNRTLFASHWEKDYFTTARPWAQAVPEYKIPGPDSMPIYSNAGMEFSTSAATATGTKMTTDASGKLQLVGINNAATIYPTTDAMYASMFGAQGVPSINMLREQFALQRFAEARARYGSRYTEYLRYLGIKSSDARLQRPEYLGGGKQTIQFSEVLSTADTTNAVVGEMKGHGIAGMRSNRFRRFFEEHGLVLSLMQVMPKPIYTQGLNRMWTRDVLEDYFQKELQHLGQQEILNKELFAHHTTPDGVFGYQDRYDEYRRIESTVSGRFLSDEDSWHFARIFATDPVLNQSFLTGDPTKRPFAEQTDDCLLVMANHSIQARRMIAHTPNPHVF